MPAQQKSTDENASPRTIPVPRQPQVVLGKRFPIDGPTQALGRLALLVALTLGGLSGKTVG
jgi:hypothetical protein